MLVSCEIPAVYDRGDLTLDTYAGLKKPELTISSQELRQVICQRFSGDSELEHFLNNYYQSGKPLVWVNRGGLNPGVDSLLATIEQVGNIGFDKESFHYSQMKKDIKALKKLDVDKNNTLQDLIARLESNLSKAYLRYTAGQRFGFVNPSYVFNYKEVNDEKGVRRIYDHKFEMDVLRPDSAFYLDAMKQADECGAVNFIAESVPKDPMYLHLQQKLNQSGRGDTLNRAKIIANMERMRWHMKDSPDKHDKYVMVNIPSFRLYGVGGDTVLTMKIVCGAVNTKSPLLSSKIKRIELNPQWVMPHSIAKNLANAGPGYFSRRNMYFVDRSGKKLSYASPEMRRKGLVSIVQRSGGGNSLGRIIFRFDNPFSVYLHHTNTPWAFTASTRAMSHGCIRLERPLDLAAFLTDNDSRLNEKISYSFSCDLSHPDSSRFVKNVPVKPEIPVYLVYYTIFSVPGTDEIVELNDIYGYDRLLCRSLAPLMDARTRQLVAKPVEHDKPAAEKKPASAEKPKQTIQEETPRPSQETENKPSDTNNVPTERDGNTPTAN